MAEDPRIELQVRDRIAFVTIDRPDALNAIDLPMRAALQSAWQRIATDADIDAAVVTGRGDKAFSAGADLKNWPTGPQPFAADWFGAGRDDSLTAGMEMDKPLVCAFNGLAFGGGLEIGLACDVRIAAQGARFALPEVRVGAIPGSGGTQRLARLIGRSDALLMLLTGDPVDAEEALRIGLVSRVLPPAELPAAAESIARRIAANAPLAVRAAKRLVREGLDLTLAQGLAAERTAWGLLCDTEDRREGREAFAQKRAAVWRGR